MLTASGTNSALLRKPIVKSNVQRRAIWPLRAEVQKGAGSPRKSKKEAHYKNLYPVGDAFVYIHQLHTIFN